MMLSPRQMHVYLESINSCADADRNKLRKKIILEMIEIEIDHAPPDLKELAREQSMMIARYGKEYLHWFNVLYVAQYNELLESDHSGLKKFFRDAGIKTDEYALELSRQIQLRFGAN